MLVNGEAVIHEILNFEIFFSNESTLRLSDQDQKLGRKIKKDKFELC